MLDQRAAERDREQLLAAADAEHRQVAGERAAGQRELGRGAALLQRHRRMPPGIAVERRIDVEGAARHHQRVEPVEPLPGQRRVVRQRDRQAAGGDDRLGVVLPQRIPGIFRVAAGLLGIEGDADHGTLPPAHVGC